MLRNIAGPIRLRLDLNRRLASDQWYRILPRVFRVHLHDRQIRRACRQPLDNDSDQRSAPAHSLSIRSARRGNNRLSLILERLMNDGNFLCSPGEESAVPHFFDTDYRRVVLQQKWNGEEVCHVLDHHADCCRLPRLQRQALGLKAYFCRGSCGCGCPLCRPAWRGCCSSRSCVLIRLRLGGLWLCWLLRRCMELALALYLYVCLGARIQWPQICFRPFRNSHDPRRQDNQHFIFLVIRLVVREEVSQQGELRKARPPFQSLAVGPLDQARKNADLAFLQPDVMLDDALADHRLRNPADAHVIRMRRHFHFQFQADVAIWMYTRRKVNIHADIQVGELCIYQRAYSARGSGGEPEAGRKTAGRDRYAIANLQFCSLTVN